MAISFMGLLLLFHPALRGSNDELQCRLLRIVIGATAPPAPPGAAKALRIPLPMSLLGRADKVFG
jgi:hypothetical protein